MIDTAEIKVKAGSGGDGLVSFRREKYIPRGGPWGGDGSKGGDVIVEVDPNLNTLNYFHRQSIYKADDGRPGMKKLMKPKDGSDLIIKVPLGTLIFDENKNLIKDFTNPSEKYLLISGGRGGLGNWHFKSSINQTPMEATEGEKRDYQNLILELKLLADVGIIGIPSSGKSTLINTLTKSNAKTAPYPFTTLEPNLGVLRVEDFIHGNQQTIVLADIPGLIEGASEGKGLGHNFLKHIERTKLLIHLVDISDEIGKTEGFFEIAKVRYNTIQEELGKWDTGLLDKPQIVALNKIDIPEINDTREEIKLGFEKMGIKILFISAATKVGLRELVSQILIVKAKEEKILEQKKYEYSEQKPVFNIDTLPNRRIVYNPRKRVKEYNPHKNKDDTED